MEKSIDEIKDELYHLCNIYQDSEQNIRVRFLIKEYIAFCMTAADATIKTADERGTMDDLYTNIVMAEYVPDQYSFCNLYSRPANNEQEFPRVVFDEGLLSVMMPSQDFLDSWAATAKELVGMPEVLQEPTYCIDIGLNTEHEGVSFEVKKLLS